MCTNVNYFLLQCMTSSKKNPPKPTEREKKTSFIWKVLVTLGRRNQMATLYQSSYLGGKHRIEHALLTEVCCQFSFHIIHCAAVILLTIIICHHDHLSLVIIICHKNNNKKKNNNNNHHHHRLCMLCHPGSGNVHMLLVQEQITPLEMCV